MYGLGGDPSAGSPTDTLLRLNPACKPEVRIRQRIVPSLRAYSHGLTGGVCKEQGHIHREMLTRDYYGIHLHEGELQPSIRTMNEFQDCLHLSVSGPIVSSFVARVWPRKFGAYGPTVDLTFLWLSASGPFNVLSNRS